MNTIVAAIDFSESSLNAARYAASLANIFGAELVLVHTYMNPQTIDKLDARLMNATGRELEEVLQEYMDQNIQILERKFTAKISGIVEEGATLKHLKRIVDNLQADLLVMGMKGKGKSSSVFGSTVIRILPNVDIPVLIIPAQSAFESIDTITLASDFDAESEFDNYRLLRTLLTQFKALLQILNVQKKNARLSEPQLMQKLQLAKSFVNQEPRFFSIEDDDVDDGIEEFLETHPSNMLVMLARKQTFFRRFFGVVHTRKMAYESKIPLLVLPGA